MVEQFINTKGGGVDFGQGIIKTHPKLKKLASLPISKQKKIVDEYFDEYYRDHQKIIEEKTLAVKQEWRKRERLYFDTTEKIFNGYKFPVGKYIAYPSIINCNPRFLDTKTFQFFYKGTTERSVYVIAHELAHFIFFDFVEKNLKKKFSSLSEESQWDLSEIFNIIILRSSAYQGIIDTKLVQPYPEHEKHIPEFDKVYKHSTTIEDFITTGIKILKK